MILFVGPLPPPVHGFAVINEAMLQLFQLEGEVRVFNRAPVAGTGLVGRAAQLLGLWGRFAAALAGAPAPNSLYLGLSGGWGQLKDLPFVLMARLAGVPILLHHHSFAYVRAQPWITRCVMRVAGRYATHVVLCDCMGVQLAKGYNLASTQLQVLSNAAFLPPPDALASRPQCAVLCMGFLSNITAAKGIWAFFELGDALLAAGVPVRARIAGPVAGDISKRFQAELAARLWCEHVGPVYGEHKTRFMHQLDVLVFPTLYVNEAEPVTLLEALREGVPVVANARGCIAEQIPADAGVVFHDDARFVAQACELLTRWSKEAPTTRQQRRCHAQQAFSAMQSHHAQQAASLVAKMTAGRIPSQAEGVRP